MKRVGLFFWLISIVVLPAMLIFAAPTDETDETAELKVTELPLMPDNAPGQEQLPLKPLEETAGELVPLDIVEPQERTVTIFKPEGSVERRKAPVSAPSSAPAVPEQSVVAAIKKTEKKPPAQPLRRRKSPKKSEPTPETKSVEKKKAPVKSTATPAGQEQSGVAAIKKTEKKPPTRPLRRRKSPKKPEPTLQSMADAPTTEAEKARAEEVIASDIRIKHEERQSKEAFTKLIKTGSIHLGNYLEPWKGMDPHETVMMNFDNKELSELLKFLSNNLQVTFILDDYIEPTRADGLQPLAGTKITFKSNVPLSLKQAWEIGLTFLEMSGFSIIPSTLPRTYRVTASASKDKPSANREPLPTFIGTDPEQLPNNDTKIRYVYFAENAELPTITQIIEAMKSGSSGPLIEVPPLRAVIITDKASHIKSLMSILEEIDRVSLPETLAIIRLKHTDARQVRELYHRLIGKDPMNPMFGPFNRQRKPTTTQYFTEATRVFEEPYTNSLIVLGTRENIKRFEDFVIKYVDKTLDLPFSPLHIIQLKYIDATSIARILNDIIQRFNADPANASAALVGGVRDSNKFFRPSVRITEETSGNRLIINADYEEYLKLRELIEKLDVEQPQVAIKVLILNVDISNTDQIGVQLRNKKDCCNENGGFNNFLGTNINFQTSNLGPFQTREPVTGGPEINGAERLLGNLINLVNKAGDVSPFGIGSTLVTLGKDLFGFWGLLAAIQNYTRVSVVANPFLVATNKYKAELKIGETRRTTAAIVEGQRESTALADISADLRVLITPQISYDDMVTLSVYIELGQFVDDTSQDRLIRKVSTEALLANKEVLALGGLIRDRVIENTSKVPFFGDIPFIGWLFKNKTKTVQRTSLLILIAPEIIKPHEPEVAQAFTFAKINDAKDTIYTMRNPSERRDPIHRWIFRDDKDKEASTIDKFVATQKRYIDESQRGREPDLIALKEQPPRERLANKHEESLATKKKGLLGLIKPPQSSQGARA